MNLKPAVLVGCLALCLQAQNLGRVSGTVNDPAGAPVPAASVALSLPGSANAQFETKTTDAGTYVFAGLRPGEYDLSVEAPGFSKSVIRNLRVGAGLETPVQEIKLEVASVSSVVEVQADTVVLQTSNAEITSVITSNQLARLPTANRSPLALLSTQAGFGSNGRSNTTINGLRVSYANVTLDGINIQDNFIRSNGLDFLPNLLLLDQVAEVTLSTSNANPSLGNGAAQVTFTTPSGTNKYKGGLFWFNRNNEFASNPWFSNANGTPRPFLNQNQIGGSLGGPIKKDKLFFYVNYEAFRLRQQSAATRVLLTETARQGIFTYLDTAGNLRQVDLLRASGLPANPTTRALIDQVPGAGNINRRDVGDFNAAAGRHLNIGGYQFNIRNNRTRDNATMKLDYVMNSKHGFSASYIWNRDIVDRPDLANDFSTAPKVQNDNSTPLLSTTWRWTASPTFTNEARGGMNIAPAVFTSSETFGNQIFALPLVSNPVNTFRSQGRYTDTFNWQDNATWVKNRHTLQFGYQGQRINVKSFNDAGNLPTYALGLSAANPLDLNALLPAVRVTDLGIGGGVLTLHAGILASVAQTFNVLDRTGGFVPGAPNIRNWRLDNHAFYLNDNWRVNDRFTIHIGTRWEYFTPVTELNGLTFVPVLQNNNAEQTLLNPNGTLDFAGSAVGRPYYKRDLNNFGPNLGIAWRPFGDKTVVRAGYSVNFPNDEFIRSIDNNVSTSEGLSTSANRINLTQTIGSSLPTLTTPTFTAPRTFAQNYAVNSQTAFGMPNPDLVTPYVQQWNFSVQREVSKGVLQVSYIGNKATKQFRAFDFNQVIINNGLLEDFTRARNNGNLARNATGTFNPAYNPNIAGSQPTPFFNALPSGGLLTNTTIRALIDSGQVGELANTYQVNRLNGSVSFYRNPNALGTNMMTNYSNATYHSLQLDYRRRYEKGFEFQVNYVFSKSLSDTLGDAQARFEPFLDLNNPSIEKAPSPFDQRHALKANGVYELPFGRKRHWDLRNPVLNQVFGGWNLSGIFTLTSGSPFGIYSSRGTLNRAARSGINTVNTTLNYEELNALTDVRKVGNGVYFLGAGVLGPDGRGSAADGRAPFSGQVFFHPTQGTLGTLQRRNLYGPRFVNLDFSGEKQTRITERLSLTLRMEALNATNTPSFFIGDQNIDSVNFGRITGTQSGRRVVQFGAYLRF
jgi:hypothetical protein